MLFIFCFLTTTFNDTLHFGHVDYREEFREKQEGCEEESEGEKVFTNIIHRWVEHGPARWNVVTVNRGNDDYKSFEPHTDVHND